MDAGSPRTPTGYWSIEHDIDLRHDQFLALRDGAREATRTGKTMVVVNGVTLRWHPIEETVAGLDAELLARAIAARANDGRKSAIIRPRNSYLDLARDLIEEYRRLNEGRDG